MNISWYINRLKTMSVGELVFRAEQLAYRKFSKQFYIGLRPKVKLNSLPTKLLPLEDEFFQSLQIDESSSFKILGLDWDYSVKHDWHLDIRSGGLFPKVFCRSVNTRSDEFGIAKYVWEPNRHQFLTRICYQFRKTGDDKWLQLFMMHLRSWYQDNPYLIGVNWYSNIEVNLRLINWFLCWEILDLNTLMEERQDVKSFVEECFTPLIYLHCKYSHNYPSKYSSANNHRIAEGVGLFIASSYWNFPESEAWNKSARKIIEHEMVAQHAASGINREETSEYIQFITDYFLVSKVVADRTGKPFTDRYESYLHNAIRYVYELMDCKGGINHYGDADNGRTFILEEDPEHFNNFKSLVVSGAMLYQDEELKSAAGNWDTKNQVLFGKDGQHTFNQVASSTKVHASQFYSNEGRYIFRKRDEEKEILMNFNAAPLGFLSIAAHGHADALSFSLSVDGFTVLVDTGTFSYHTDMPWRNYFKGTLAHNTVIRVEKGRGNFSRVSSDSIDIFPTFPFIKLHNFTSQQK